MAEEEHGARMRLPRTKNQKETDKKVLFKWFKLNDADDLDVVLSRVKSMRHLLGRIPEIDRVAIHRAIRDAGNPIIDLQDPRWSNLLKEVHENPVEFEVGEPSVAFKGKNAVELFRKAIRKKELNEE
jgi:hypothetical protein